MPPMKILTSPDLVLHKALRLLTHPAALLALALLLVNDHVLRRLWPSALTGKLGDFAWLFFIPLVVVALLALLTPGRSQQRARVLPILAYGAVALVFTLAKTVPAVHASVVSAASALFGFPVGWRMDPSDLFALPALALSAWLWRSTPQPAVRTMHLAPAGWLALIFAALLTVANSPAPDYGIYCLDERSGEIDAFAGYTAFRSTDGGLTWAAMPNQRPSACPNPWSSDHNTSITAADPANPQRQFRFTAGQSIEASADGGATWQTIRQMPPLTQVRAVAVRRRLSSGGELRPLPLDAKVDRATGNAVFAMGHAGVLVLDARTGAWREVGVGPYAPATLGGPVDALGLLLGEMLLALGIALLAFDTLATRLLARGKGLWIAALVIAWLIWTAIVFLFPPALAYGYGAGMTYIALLVLGVILLVLTAIAVVGSLQHGKGLTLRAVLTSLAAAVLFFLPYVLWAVGALPEYLMASIFGTLLGVAAIVVGARWPHRAHDRAR